MVTKKFMHTSYEGSTKQSYDKMNKIIMPSSLTTPSVSVSVLICSLNTKATYLHDCLRSILTQVGYFNIEIVWVNDGSDELHTKILEKL